MKYTDHLTPWMPKHSVVFSFGYIPQHSSMISNEERLATITANKAIKKMMGKEK